VSRERKKRILVLVACEQTLHLWQSREVTRFLWLLAWRACLQASQGKRLFQLLFQKQKPKKASVLAGHGISGQVCWKEREERKPLGPE